MSSPAKVYRFSAAALARREGRMTEERDRIALALRKHRGNVMKAWREDLSSYTERTLKRWIRAFGLQVVVDEERRKERAEKLGRRAAFLACGAGASPNGSRGGPARPNG